jgi:hypothetical protein
MLANVVVRGMYVVSVQCVLRSRGMGGLHESCNKANSLLSQRTEPAFASKPCVSTLVCLRMCDCWYTFCSVRMYVCVCLGAIVGYVGGVGRFEVTVLLMGLLAPHTPPVGRQAACCAVAGTVSRTQN